MKRLYFILIILSLCFVNMGYTYTVDEVFKNFKSVYEKCQNFSADFEETALYKTRKSVSHGRFTFGIPNLLHMEYVSAKDPENIVKTVVLDGKFMWSYVPLLNEVNKQKLKNPQRREILPGTGATLEDLSNNWNMKLVTDKAAKSKGVYLMQLTPKPELLNRHLKKTVDGEEVKEKLEIWVKEGDWFPVQFGYVTVFEDGSRRSVIITLSNIKRDKKLPPDKFKFVVPKDAEIIDLTAD